MTIFNSSDYYKNQPKIKSELEFPYQHYLEPTKFAKDERNMRNKRYMGKNDRYEEDLDKMRNSAINNYKRALDAADKRPLHRKGSLNREL